MDPNFIGASEWKQISTTLTFLIAVPLSVIGFAFPMLFGCVLLRDFSLGFDQFHPRFRGIGANIQPTVDLTKN